MSKYNHFEMCKKIFGQKYKWNEQKHDYEPYSRTDMWNKMIEQRKQIADLEANLAESEKKIIEANNLRKNSDEVLLNYKTKKYGLDKTIQELRKMKLSLPEKEWYYKGFENCERQMSSYIADLTLEVKELRQQLEEKEKYTYTGKEVGKIEQNYDNQLAITKKALELAVKDKCKFENALLSTSLGIAGGKVAVPKKEQWYIEQAENELNGE